MNKLAQGCIITENEVKKYSGETPANAKATSLEEGEHHTAANDELIALAEEGLYHTNL